MFKFIGEVLGTVTGLIVGLPVVVIAETLGVAEDVIVEAKKHGCETYEEIRQFIKEIQE